MKYPGMSDDPGYNTKRNKMSERLGGMLFGWAYKIREVGPELDALYKGRLNGTYDIPEDI